MRETPHDSDPYLRALLNGDLDGKDPDEVTRNVEKRLQDSGFKLMIERREEEDRESTVVTVKEGDRSVVQVAGRAIVDVLREAVRRMRG